MGYKTQNIYNYFHSLHAVISLTKAVRLVFITANWALRRASGL